MKKRLLSILLAALMVVSLLPTVAFATEINTVADVLATNPNFPTCPAGQGTTVPENAWTDENGRKMYNQGNCLTILSLANSTTSINTGDETNSNISVTSDGNGNYTYSQYGGVATWTFVMVDGKLDSVQYANTNSGMAEYVGTYTAPAAPITSVTLSYTPKTLTELKSLNSTNAMNIEITDPTSSKTDLEAKINTFTYFFFDKSNTLLFMYDPKSDWWGDGSFNNTDYGDLDFSKVAKVAELIGYGNDRDTPNWFSSSTTVSLVDGSLTSGDAYMPTDFNQYKILVESENYYGIRVNIAYDVEQTYTVTLDKQGGTGGSDSVTATYGEAMPNATMPTKAGYTFNGYFDTTSGGIKYYNANGSSAKNWDKATDTNLYAQWSEIPAPPAPSYDSGSSSSTVTVPVTGDENTVKVSATVSGNTATVKKINDADLTKVTEGESVSIDLSAAGKNVDTAKIPTETVEKIAEKSAMTVKLPVATVEFDKAATEEIADQAKGSNIELVVDDIKEVSLNAVQKETVKKLDTAIIIDAHLASNGSRLCTAENGGFGSGKANVILPYEIKNNRKPENYSVFYVNEAGKLEKLNAVYDEELKAFVFEIEHFSVYAVAFEQFVDIDANAYYYDAVKWAAANGITDGTDSTHFSPNGITNRGQMVTFLWRAAGKPEPTLTECPFTDVETDSYYYKAVLWAYENGITDGTTATTFEPDKNVSRAQTVTFLWRYAGKPVLDYWMQMTDVASGQYYTEAVRWALAEGITEGTSKTTFSPNDDCLRGQIVTFLYRSLVK